MAGTVTMVSIRSSEMARRNAPTSKTGMITAVPPLQVGPPAAPPPARPACGPPPPRPRPERPVVGAAGPAADLDHGRFGAMLLARRAEHVDKVAGQAVLALHAVRAADDSGHV